MGSARMLQAEETGIARTLPVGSRWRGALAALLVGAAGMAAWPFAQSPFGDDFTYARTTMDFALTGHVIYNGWAAPSQGWMILWGGLFLKLFGFSVQSLHLSSLPLAMLCVYLFHQILLRFHVSPRGAMLGALTLGLSPLFLPLSTMYMTDIPGLLMVLVCVAMCQRAVLARTDFATIAWLLGAAAVNTAGGTVRQICWVAGIVMVPATAWLLRRRRGVLPAGILGGVLTLAGEMTVSRWFIHQPHTWTERLISGPIVPRRVAHLALEIILSTLFATMITAPVGVAWFKDRRPLSRAGWARVASGMAVFTAVLVFLLHAAKWNRVDLLTMPWLEPVVLVQGMARVTRIYVGDMVLSFPVRAVLSVLIVGFTLWLLEQLAGEWGWLRGLGGPRSRAVFWITVPFFAATVAALSGRAMFAEVQDRYLLGLEPFLLLGMLLVYERRVSERIPGVSFAMLAVFAVYAIAGNHDLHAGLRAEDAATHELVNAGVPRTRIAEGFGPDGFLQVADGGHMNESLLSEKPKEYDPAVPDWGLPADCAWFYETLMPKIRPKYFVATQSGGPCFEASGRPPVAYRAWLPPFQRDIFVLQKAPPLVELPAP